MFAFLFIRPFPFSCRDALFRGSPIFSAGLRCDISADRPYYKAPVPPDKLGPWVVSLQVFEGSIPHWHPLLQTISFILHRGNPFSFLHADISLVFPRPQLTLLQLLSRFSPFLPPNTCLYPATHPCQFSLDRCEHKLSLLFRPPSESNRIDRPPFPLQVSEVDFGLSPQDCSIQKCAPPTRRPSCSRMIRDRVLSSHCIWHQPLRTLPVKLTQNFELPFSFENLTFRRRRCCLGHASPGY